MSPSRSRSAGAATSSPSTGAWSSETSMGSGEEVCTSVIGESLLLSGLLLCAGLAHGLHPLNGLLLRLLFNRKNGCAIRLDQLALLGETGLTSLRGVGARSRHVADDQELLTHGPQVGGQPVEHDAERESEA